MRRASAYLSRKAIIRSHTQRPVDILIALCPLRVVPSTPRVPSPAAFERRPVVHAGRFGIGRHPKPFTEADEVDLSILLDRCVRFEIT